MALALGLLGNQTHLECGIAGVGFARKFQIGHGIFMRAKDLCFVRQRRQLGERCHHLLGCSFEQSPAAAGKQGVAAEEPSLFPFDIGNMAARVAWYIQNIELQWHFGYLDDMAFAERMRDVRNRLVARPEYRYVEAIEQGGHTIDMVMVVMSQ